MTPETPTQPPAAPEPDVRLSEAEWERVHRAMRNWRIDDRALPQEVRVVVECIVAERLRVVEGERDAALADAARADHVTDTLIERAQRIGMSVRAADPSRYAGWTEDQWAADAVQIMDSIDGSCADLVNGHVHALIRKAARAESAEAAHEALRKGIEALADEWTCSRPDRQMPGPLHRVACFSCSHADRLRALAGGAS